MKNLKTLDIFNIFTTTHTKISVMSAMYTCLQTFSKQTQDQEFFSSIFVCQLGLYFDTIHANTKVQITQVYEILKVHR